jgi:hypothetical protein
MAEKLIRHILNFTLGYRPSFIERIILAFCPMCIDISEAGKVWYKYYADRFYVYKIERAAVPEPFTGGANKPWTN